jgi:hypothetical protein
MAKSNRLSKKEKKISSEDRSFWIILTGIAFILLVSFMDGFGYSFNHMIVHLQQDLNEWAIHLYILGWILVFYGLYRLKGK